MKVLMLAGPKLWAKLVLAWLNITKFVCPVFCTAMINHPYSGQKEEAASHCKRHSLINRHVVNAPKGNYSFSAYLLFGIVSSYLAKLIFVKF